MKTIFIATSAVVLLTACAPKPTPTPLCDRANIEWNKHGTAEVPLECKPQAGYVPFLARSSDNDSAVDSDRPDNVGPSHDRPHSDPPSDHVKPKHEKPKHEQPKHEQPKHVKPKHEKPKPREHVSEGNPGNDKDVGRAGEKIDKGMAERGTVGNRGRSN